jgi:hypothetical protein
MGQRRWFIRPYRGALGAWLRYGKPVLSDISGWLGPKDALVPGAPFVFGRIQERNPATLDELADWLADHSEWTSDPVGGLVDYFPTAENIEWQFNHRDGIFRDDCDGLAYASALAVRPFCTRPEDDYLATVIYDPTEVPVQGSAHVLNLFHHASGWRVFSNCELDSPVWATPRAALYENSYYRGWCRGAELQYIEVRSPELRLLAAGLQQARRLWDCALTR